ncbi:segregation and condensation protein A [Melioribacter sp. OK-6-Me]|uniref:segregation and condensation protein A n=1 Tax=unclassified Melioribacter TaxID=2627329 RepID=UPI003EDACDBC
MYKIKLTQFEGPLDLLLFFIKRDELNIYDIPISKITKDFMDYLKMLQQLDLEIAGDFILMAATLMQIKVKMLLPKEVDEKGEEIDPRADLVKALLEYKRYKEMTEEFSFMESNMRNYSFRSNFEYDEKEKSANLDVLLKNISIYDLIKAFKKVIESKKEEPVHEIKKWNVTIEEQIDYIEKKVKLHKRITFNELMKEMVNKIRIIVTFIAVLEMVKSGQVGIEESPNFNDFIIYGLSDG